MELEIVQKSSFVEFDIIAKPKSGADAILGVHDGALRVSVKAAPEKGKANASIIKFLSKSLGIPQNSVSIISGATSRRKRVKITDVTVNQIRGILPG